MKKYFKSYEDIVRNQEDTPPQPGDTREIDQLSELDLMDQNGQKLTASRRDFLKVFGFSVTAAALAASCENPVKKAIPLLNRPEEARPGRSLHYASTFATGDKYASVLVRVRDGRPIKVEGNDMSSIDKGGSDARTQAMVLSLYDDGARYRTPVIGGEEATWEEADKKVMAALEAAGGEKEVALITPTVYSPSARRAIAMFSEKYNTRHVQLDAISYSGMLEANRLTFGSRFIPSYRFDKADIIVGFGADFLGTWLSPVEYARQWASGRDLIGVPGKMSMHIQFEAGMTVTGSSADKRVRMTPSQQGAALVDLYSAVSGNTLAQDPFGMATLGSKLLQQKGKALVVSGSNDQSVQVIVNAINEILGSYGSTIDTSIPMYTKQGIDTDLMGLFNAIEEEKVGVLITWDSNPVYECLSGEFWKDVLGKVPVTVSFANARTETSVLSTVVCPDHHPLEAWGDAEPRKGYYSLAQPTIQPVYNTRQAIESLQVWSGSETSSYDFVKETWQTGIAPNHQVTEHFETFWGKTLQAGVFEPGPGETSPLRFDHGAVAEALDLEFPEGEFELDLYESIQIGNGSLANNPWLQELPDPITKISWDNYAAVSPADAEKQGWSDGDVIYINEKVLLPVLIQPGQADGCISIALGYGRTEAGKAGDNVGGNAYVLGRFGKARIYDNATSDVRGIGYSQDFARSQEHHTMEGRDIVRETTLADYLESPDAGNEKHAVTESHHLTLYPEVEYPTHRWGLSINLNACIGCSACVIACQAENNVAVVGKDEVRRRRIMHWIRIDRYYSENASDPEVVFQPLMCQHCDNAPCENVCPVAATMHSNDGLNQMAYNRCVGTKYCINNCPYKVRRFNWFRYATNEEFDYNQNSDLGRMVLNPDVVVRERGVVEKCSFCVQRIQEGKLIAKMENRTVEDKDFLTACMQTCPTNAIAFGDLQDDRSKVSKLFANPRNYHLLEELHTLPSVGYLTKVRNTETDQEA